MTTPPPRQVYAELREAEGFVHHDKRLCGTRDGRGRLIECLACLFQWLHNTAYERSSAMDMERGRQKHSHGGARAASAEERDNAEVVLGPDSVGSLLVEKEAMRRDLARAASELHRATRALRAMEAALLSAQKRVPIRPSPPSAARYPRTATVEDVRKSHEAQGRRREAGEAIA